MTNESGVRVPIGSEADAWVTRTRTRTVIGIIHNVTSATRLLDILALLERDLRIQVVVTWTGSSPFTDGVPELLAKLGYITIPWHQALAEKFDLAISASHGGEQHRINAPLIIVPHGMGYNKLMPEAGSRKPEAGSRKPEAGSRKPEAGSRKPEVPVFGLSSEWLVADGRVVPSVLVLSHSEQLRRLAVHGPEAVTVATVAGDPCFDRMLAARAWRDEYRSAFGVRGRQRLVVVSSTWGRESLFGRYPGLPRALMRALPVDEYRVVAALHPNVWHAHGRRQVRAWLADCVAAGLVLLPPLDGWRAALAAADCVVGDYGSVTFYGAALDLPVVLAGFPDELLDPASPIAALGRAAPRLQPAGGLEAQIRAVIEGHRPGRWASITQAASELPGRSAEALRDVLYQALGLAPPTDPPAVLRLPVPRWVERHHAAATLAAVDVRRRTDGDGVGAEVHVVRWPYPVAAAGNTAGTSGAEDPLLVAEEDAEDQRVVELADIIIRAARPADPVTPSHEMPGRWRMWARRTLRRYPGCWVAAAAVGSGWRLMSREGTVLVVRASRNAAFGDGCADVSDAGGSEPRRYRSECSLGPAPATAAVAAGVTGWLTSGSVSPQLTGDVVLRVGPETCRLTIAVQRVTREA